MFLNFLSFNTWEKHTFIHFFHIKINHFTKFEFPYYVTFHKISQWNENNILTKKLAETVQTLIECFYWIMFHCKGQFHRCFHYETFRPHFTINVYSYFIGTLVLYSPLIYSLILVYTCSYKSGLQIRTPIANVIINQT